MNKDKCKVCNTELEAPNANYDEWHCCNCITNPHRRIKAKHTEGQWVVQNPHYKTGVRVSKKIAKGYVGNIHYQYVSIADITDGEYDGEQEANANLIASAPEMLEMVKEIVRYVEENGLDKMPIEEGSAEYFTCTLYWHFAKDLLARAEGETEKAIIMEEARLFPDEE